MPVRNSGPELLLRRELHRRGLRFRVNLVGLPGTPDVALTRARIAVFVDGCFWHACDEHGSVPKNNRAWWEEKFQRTRERDARKDAALRELGWEVIHMWEHENHVDVADHIEGRWRERSAQL